MTRIALPGVLTLLMVVGFVGVAGWNRSGEPGVTLVVTERELTLPWNPAPAPGDDPGLQLRIQYEPRRDAADARNWLTEDRLRRLGFAVDIPAGAPEAEQTYDRMPPRIGWVAFEYDGPAWTAINRARSLTREETAPSLDPSRLVPVDAGPEFDELRARYPDGHLILRAVLRVGVQRVPAGGGILYGYIGELVPGEVTVPRHLRPALAGLRSPVVEDARPPEERTPIAPRYEAEIAVGQAGLPYLRALRRIS